MKSFFTALVAISIGAFVALSPAAASSIKICLWFAGSCMMPPIYPGTAIPAACVTTLMMV
ncbi:MAG: hypothetical protein ACRD4E_08945 [Bryobacteraceae bacterium]